MKLLYILSNHGEDGAENVSASLDPALLRPLVRGLSGSADGDSAEQQFDSLVALGEQAIDPKYGHNLTDGWGGPQLHIVELLE